MQGHDYNDSIEDEEYQSADYSHGQSWTATPGTIKIDPSPPDDEGESLTNNIEKSWQDYKSRLPTTIKSDKPSPDDEDLSLKKHLKQLLVLQNQERGVEDEIVKLKDKIYSKMQRKGIQISGLKSKSTDPSMNNAKSSPFGSIGPPQEAMMSNENLRLLGNLQDAISSERRSSRSIEKNHYRTLIDENKLEEEEGKEISRSQEDFHRLLDMSKASNKSRIINLKIENHGKQAIFIL